MVILLVAISICVCISLVFVLLGCFQCFAGKRSRGFSNFENPDEEAAQATRENAGFSLGPSDLVTVDSSAFTSVTIEPLPDILAKSISTSALRPRIRCIEKSKQESALRLITVHHPFPRVQLTYLKEIGSTWFGQVIESDAEKITGVARNRVIVKVLSDNASAVEQKQFLEDVAPYRELDHTNVIRLLGQCTETTPLLLVLEFAPLGDLKSYLRNHKTGSAMFTQKNLQIKFALDVASGLDCLHGHSYIHHDLAARTCLVAGDLTVKIGDYGICEDKYKVDYYNNGQELLPLRWMAPESLELQDNTWQITNISKECNIWSYGVLLWEIMTYANKPYTTLHDEQVLDDVIKQKLIKLRPPDSAIPYKDRVFEVMQFCWLKSEQRPQVEEVHGLLQRLYEQTSQSDTCEDQFEKKWDSLIPQEAQIPRQDNICVNSKEPQNFESDFIASNETTSITSDEFIGKNPEKFSTTVNGGLDFSPSLPVDGISKQELPSTPIRPNREHLTSTPLTKDKNFENNLQNKPVRNIEAIMKTEDVAPMNDSLLDDEAFENDSKPEDYQQTETFVTSADTVTSGVVTGDFSLSDKHSEKMMLSSPLSIPSLQIEEIQLKAKENLSIPQSSSVAINNPEKVFERPLPDLLEKEISEATNEEDKNVTEGQRLRRKTDDNVEMDITSNNNVLVLDSVDILSELNDGNCESTTDPDNTARLSDSFSDFVEISNNSFNPLTPGDINSTLGADIDEFMNASFDSPNNLSDDKSVDNLTDFSELDLILNCKTNSDLSSYNESLEETNPTVGKTSNSPETTPIHDATNQVFETNVLTTDLDEDLPPLTDNNTNITENTDTISHNVSDL